MSYSKKQTELKIFSKGYVILHSVSSFSYYKIIAGNPTTMLSGISLPQASPWAQCHRSQSLSSLYWFEIQGSLESFAQPLCGRLFNKYYFLLIVMVDLSIPVFQKLKILWVRIKKNGQGWKSANVLSMVDVTGFYFVRT